MKPRGVRDDLQEIAAENLRFYESYRNVRAAFRTDLGHHQVGPIWEMLDVEPRRRGGQLLRRDAFALEPENAHRLHPGKGLRHGSQLRRRAVPQPEAPTFDSVDKLFGPNPTAEEGFGGRFKPQKLGFFLGSEEVVAVVDGLVPDPHGRHVANRFRPVGDRTVRPFHQVGAYVLGRGRGGTVLAAIVINDRLAANLKGGPVGCPGPNHPPPYDRAGTTQNPSGERCRCPRQKGKRESAPGTASARAQCNRRAPARRASYT